MDAVFASGGLRASAGRISARSVDRLVAGCRTHLLAHMETTSLNSVPECSSREQDATAVATTRQESDGLAVVGELERRSGRPPRDLVTVAAPSEQPHQAIEGLDVVDPAHAGRP
jgi:hypothetical protein